MQFQKLLVVAIKNKDFQIRNMKTNDGININSELCPTVNRYGDSVRFVRYSLIK